MATQLHSTTNLTTNLLATLVYPIKQLAKLLHLSPPNWPQNSTKMPPTATDQLLQSRNDETSTTCLPATQNSITTIVKRQLSNRNAAQQRKTTRLPHVTHADLLNINQIHAASLNGLAGQFVHQSSLAPASPQAQPAPVEPMTSQPVEAPSSQQTRKASQSSSVSQFVVAPTSPNSLLEISQPPVAIQNPVILAEFSTQAPRARPNVNGQHQQGLTTTSSTLPSIGSKQQASPAYKFPFATSQQQQQHPAGFDSTPLATTNSISIQTSNQGQQPISSVLASSPSTTSASTSSSSTATTLASAQPAGGHQHHASHHQAGHNVLASFSPPVRSHNTLASAKYSLDGIIAVAIFGGFIFLGAIITIIVIIIRR